MSVELVVTFTKDVRKKRNKKWLDGTLIVDKITRKGRLVDEEGKKTLAWIDSLPADVSLDRGGGEAFVMDTDGKQAYLVQVDDVGVDEDVQKPVEVRSGLVNARTLITKGDHAEPRTARRRRTPSELLGILGISMQKGNDRGAPDVSRKEEEKKPELVKEEECDVTEEGTLDSVVHETAWKKPVKKILKSSNNTYFAMKGGHASPVENAGTDCMQGECNLVCPTVEEVKHPVRKIHVATAFDSAGEYMDVMRKSMIEEVFLKMIANTFADLYNAFSSSSNMLGHAEVENLCQKARIPYHGECQVKTYRNSTNNKEFFSKTKKNKRRAWEEDQEDGSVQDAKKEQVYLILGSSRGKASSYHKSDVWILSNSPTFGFKKGQSVWTCFAKSVWHGPNKDGKFEIEFISRRPSQMGRSARVYAIQGPEASIELGLLSLLGDPTSVSAPMLSHLLQLYKTDAISSPEPEGAMEEFREVSNTFNLNTHQAEVLSHVARWHTQPTHQPICLVHGPFGSGKSQLMVSILHLILALRRSKESTGGLSNARVLVCSHTNIAVDRVLIGLMRSGVSDFLRVGALKKIHHEILEYSIHASESKSHNTALGELKEMAKAASGQVLLKLQAEIAEAERGSDRKRKKMLKTCPIVGVTCVSTALSILEDQTFDILILDEASQLTEPLSLAPIIRSKCKYVIAAGDPNQLPPVVCSPEHVQGGHSVARPLFVRLTDLGHSPHLLRTQYRCHPDIACVSNKFFYQNQLLDGITPEQRPPLAKILPAVSVVDIMLGQESYSHRSIYNDMEARAVASIIQKFLGHGISPNAIGVIAFYKAHVDALTSAVSNIQGGQDGIHIATVDSFQGAEKDIIILSTATSKPSSFAADACRLNVALTRAKHHLLLVGNIHSLSKGIPSFEFILSRAKTHKGYFLGGLPADI